MNSLGRSLNGLGRLMILVPTMKGSLSFVG